MIKSITVAATAIMLAGSLAVCADEIDWGNGDFIYTPGGVAIPNGSAGYTVTMWVDGGNGLMDNYGTGDDTMIAGLTASFNQGPGSDGFFAAVIDPVTYGITDGSKVYTRVFNNTTPATSTFYVNVDNSEATVLDSTPPLATPWAYDPGATLANGSDWKPVPEPATLALLGLGMAGTAIRRRVRKS